jgi:hypothetical protein
VSLSGSVVLLFVVFPRIPFVIVCTLRYGAFEFVWENLIRESGMRLRGTPGVTANLPSLMDVLSLETAAGALVAGGVMSALGMYYVSRPVSEPRRHARGLKRTRRASSATVSTARLVIAGMLPPQHTGSVAYVTLGLILFFVSLLPYGLGWFAVILATCYISVMAMKFVRQSAALDEVASTPIPDLDLAQAVVAVNLSRARVCFLPLLAGAAVVTAYFLRQALIGHNLSRSSSGLWSFDGLTWLAAMAIGVMVIAMVLVLQLICALSLSSWVSAAGYPVSSATALSVIAVILLLTLGTVIPFFVYMRSQQMYDWILLNEIWPYLSTCLFIAWNIAVFAGTAYATLKQLAASIRGQDATTLAALFPTRQ